MSTVRNMDDYYAHNAPFTVTTVGSHRTKFWVINRFGGTWGGFDTEVHANAERDRLNLRASFAIMREGVLLSQEEIDAARKQLD